MGEVADRTRSIIDRRLPWFLAVAIAATVVVGFSYAQWLDKTAVDEQDLVRFLAIQPVLPRTERFAPLSALQSANADRLLRLTEQALTATQSTRPIRTTVVWPENSVVLLGDVQSALESIRHRLRKMKVSGILGVAIAAQTAGFGSLQNTVLAIEPDGALAGQMLKSIAVPVLEAEPSSILDRAAAASIGRAGESQKTRTDARLGPLKGTNGAVVMLCFEALFPWVVEARREDRTRVILNLADDSWIDSAVPTHQLTAILRFRAIEQRLPALRVAHGGLSASFDHFGQPLDALPLDRDAWLSLDVAPRGPESFSMRLRLLALPLAVGVLAYLLFPWVVRIHAR